ncbi:MAG: glutaredoxin family protein [Anaerolineae bacterium]|nr:glutaredoxin family protein [Anaerolineae bacterium]
MLYALSTCGWCKKARAFLDDNNVEYDYIYVDELKGARRDEVMEAVRRWNPKGSFPTVVVDGARAVAGFKEDELREVLGL